MKRRDRSSLASQRRDSQHTSLNPRPGRTDRRSNRFRTQLLVLAVCAFAIRLALVWQLRPSPFFDVLLGDARRYDAWAQQIARGDWIGHDVFYQAPLYPYFLGLIYSIAGRDLLLVRTVQAGIGAAGCVLLALAGRRWISEKAGLIAGICLAVYAPAIFHEALLQKSVLDLFFMSAILWLLGCLGKEDDRRVTWFWLGLTLGALALTRENALIFIVPIVGWQLAGSPGASRRRLSALAAVVLGLFVVLFPIALRNRLAGGEWHLTTSQFGSNLYLGNNASADGTATALREGRGSVEFERQDAAELAEAAVGRKLTPGQVSGYWTRQALAFIRSNPGTWLRLERRKLTLLVNRAELIDTESQESYEEWSAVLRSTACSPSDSGSPAAQRLCVGTCGSQ